MFGGVCLDRDGLRAQALAPEAIQQVLATTHAILTTVAS